MRGAAVSTTIAIALGTLAAAAIYKKKFFGRETISLLILLPIALPGIITDISLRSEFNIGSIPFSFWTIVLGHATFCIAVTFIPILVAYYLTRGTENVEGAGK